MNVFFLDEDPDRAGMMQCDKHVVKMNCEYAQMMSTAHRVIDGKKWTDRTANGRKISRWWLENELFDKNLYKASHINHPSNIWLRKNPANYQWLYRMWVSTLREYERRYERTHESKKLISLLGNVPEGLANKPYQFSQPPPAMKEYPQCIVPGDAVTSYRNYYWEAKRSFATWKTGKPAWWVDYEKNAKAISEYV